MSQLSRLITMPQRFPILRVRVDLRVMAKTESSRFSELEPQHQMQVSVIAKIPPFFCRVGWEVLYPGYPFFVCGGCYSLDISFFVGGRGSCVIARIPLFLWGGWVMVYPGYPFFVGWSYAILRIPLFWRGGGSYTCTFGAVKSFVKFCREGE